MTASPPLAKGNPSLPGPTAEKPRLTEEEKKSNHIASEQKRRQAIRQGFDRLASIVPGMEGQGRSEAIVLEATVKYMKEQYAVQHKLVAAAKAKGLDLSALGLPEGYLEALDNPAVHEAIAAEEEAASKRKRSEDEGEADQPVSSEEVDGSPSRVLGLRITKHKRFAGSTWYYVQWSDSQPDGLNWFQQDDLEDFHWLIDDYLKGLDMSLEGLNQPPAEVRQNERETLTCRHCNRALSETRNPHSIDASVDLDLDNTGFPDDDDTSRVLPRYGNQEYTGPPSFSPELDETAPRYTTCQDDQMIAFPFRTSDSPPRASGPSMIVDDPHGVSDPVLYPEDPFNIQGMVDTFVQTNELAPSSGPIPTYGSSATRPPAFDHQHPHSSVSAELLTDNLAPTFFGWWVSHGGQQSTYIPETVNFDPFLHIEESVPQYGITDTTTPTTEASITSPVIQLDLTTDAIGPEVQMSTADIERLHDVGIHIHLQAATTAENLVGACDLCKSFKLLCNKNRLRCDNCVTLASVCKYSDVGRDVETALDGRGCCEDLES